MVLSLNEIKKNAIAFSHEWKDETSEKAEAQTFWNDFFNIFGISRRRIATFEKPGIKSDGGRGFIDLFWKGKLVVEHKSADIKDLDKAYSQALDYFSGLDEDQLPRYVIVTNFKKIRLYDLDESKEHEFELINLIDNLNLFDFIPEHRRISYEEENPVNIKASELMGKLHDSLKNNGYVGHHLEILLVRLMFCLFADDTSIFPKNSFTFFVDKKTNVDGSDIGVKLISIFEVLDTPSNKRQINLDEDLNLFPYIDGSLFEERISIPSFDSETRRILLKCCEFNWSEVSPAVFGSLFQSVMDQKERHDIGGHYTSEKNILKTIEPLFLNKLNSKFKKYKNNKRELELLLRNIGKIKILDPACGCGNFLIISYRELRRLQIKIHKRIRELQGYSSQRVLDINFDEDLNVDSMYGIELLEFPARIAQVGLWLIDHMVNMELSKEFGYYYQRLPLRKSANIKIGNALNIDWNELIDKNELTYIVGNPPFISKQDRDAEQNRDMDLVCKNIKNFGLLDYVTCWYIKATEYIKDTTIPVAFVSTNSITQGEQVGIISEYLIKEHGIKINFAHRTFKWTSDARGKASVYVVIIGFGYFDYKSKFIYDYEKPNSEPVKIKAKHINFYLVDSEDVFIFNRRKPLCDVPGISFGSMPNDKGNFLFSNEEKKEFIKLEPGAKSFFRHFVSAREYFAGKKRWCLWLKDISPSELNKLKHVKERVQNVKEYRLASNRHATRKLAEFPYLFGEIRQPDTNYILVPRVSSENRRYIPFSYFNPNYIVGDTCLFIPNANHFYFGLISSAIHMAWVNQVCGRLKSDYRYSSNLVYNNFPFPIDMDSEKIDLVKKLAKEVINVRKEFDSSLSDLYNPLTMPKKLLLEHKKLDKAVDKCYRSKPFKSDLERLKFLFEKYNELISKK